MGSWDLSAEAFEERSVHPLGTRGQPYQIPTVSPAGLAGMGTAGVPTLVTNCSLAPQPGGLTSAPLKDS